jgi:NMD protein affecting ribosome stability and mRNA decay
MTIFCKSCGNQARVSKYNSNGMCNPCRAKEREARLQHNQAIVQTGLCPDCGSKLKRNCAMSGWWQCEQFGSEQFRARPNAPECNFQVFTA